MPTPTRKAILIGAPGNGDEYLPGVNYDLENWNNFLQAPRGGAWYPNEIEIYSDADWANVRRAINNAIADYVFVYFSGHGYMDCCEQNILCLKDSDILDKDLYSLSPRQLVIVDACRSYLPAISGIPKEVEKWLYATGYSESRILFDNYILQARPGKAIIHATAAGQVSYDNRRGGEFSLALLKVVFQYRPLSGAMPIYINTALADAAIVLKNDNSSQVPQITSSIGYLEVPIAIASSNFILKKIRQPQTYRIPKKINNDLGSAVGTAAAVLILIAVLGGFD